jgi:phytoene synthase
VSFEADVEHCRALLRAGSQSFDAAARLLPARLVPSVAVLYAFCRVSDDAIDEAAEPEVALSALRRRLDEVFAGTATADPVDRALTAVVRAHRLPRAPLDALLEGYAWDASGRRYGTLEALLGYCARVASSVGVAMTHLMGVDDRRVLARAIDLGAAMQLTNVARDVGQDARMGRLYLPSAWVGEPALERLTPTPAIRRATSRLLDEADVLYERALLGVPYLPADCRLAIRAAAAFYRQIGAHVRRAGGDGVTRRHATSPLEKAALLAELALEPPAPRRPLSDDVLAEAAFLLP